MTGYGYGGDPGLAVPDPGSITMALLVVHRISINLAKALHVRSVHAVGVDYTLGGYMGCL
jgi:hypothetical protein